MTTTATEDSWSSVELEVRAELLRLGTPEDVLPQRLEVARREWNLPRRSTSDLGDLTPERLAQRVVLVDSASAIALKVARMLNLRKNAGSRQGDVVQDALEVLLRNDCMQHFYAPTTAPPRGGKADEVARAVAEQRDAVARYVTGFAWRRSANEYRTSRRQERLRGSLGDGRATRVDDAEHELAEICDWVDTTFNDYDREVFIACVIEGREHEEVAEVLGVSPKAIESRKGRVLERIRARYGERSGVIPVPLLLAANADDLDALLRRLGEYARRRAEPTAEELKRLREHIERGLLGGGHVTPEAVGPRRFSRTATAGVGAGAAMLGFVAALALRPTPSPPQIRLVRVEVPVERVAPTEPVSRLAQAAVPPTTVAPPRAPDPTLVVVHRERPARPRPLAETPLARETSLLNTAQSALVSQPSRPEDALSVINEHERMFPQGQLIELREFLRVRSLQTLGRGASEAEDGFRRRFPDSPYLTRFEPRTRT